MFNVAGIAALVSDCAKTFSSECKTVSTEIQCQTEQTASLSSAVIPDHHHHHHKVNL
jgi:hypothetical protein